MRRLGPGPTRARARIVTQDRGLNRPNIRFYLLLLANIFVIILLPPRPINSIIAVQYKTLYIYYRRKYCRLIGGGRCRVTYTF